MLSFPGGDPAASSSHNKSQPEDKPKMKRMAKPGESRRKIQIPDEVIIKDGI